MQEIINTFKKRKNLYAFMFVVLISFFAFHSIRKSFSLLIPVRSVDIYSNNVSYANNDPGSWKVTKSASWTGAGKARITVDVDTVLKTGNRQYKDIIMVLDISDSMNGNKLTRVKEDSVELINSVLEETNNKIALITFESNSTLVSGLTNDKNTLISYINNLTDTGCTNYYRALQNVGTILENYTKQNNRDCIVMFLTDGYPNEGTPNQIGEYQFLKDIYPHVTFNGIQYEMGNTVLEPIKQISDNQWIADMNNLNNVLFDAAVAPITYEEFTFIDYIDTNYFNIASVDSIKTKIGNVSLDGNKVTWSINDELMSGDKASLTIDVTLKNEYLNIGGTYPTNLNEEVISKLEGNSNENVSSNLTPVLQDNYMVIYDGNAPSSCTVSNVPNSQSKSVYTNVQINSAKPVCSGYQFKGWELVTEVTKVNDDYFIMPESDVTIRAVWSKLALTKSMNGVVSEAYSLYTVLEDEATRTDIVEGERFARTYTGAHQDSMDSSKSTRPIYYWYATDNDTMSNVFNRNNVLFGGYCWQMIRTTDTGGVRLLYNGVPSITGSGDNISYSCDFRRPLYFSETKTTMDLSGGRYFSSTYTNSGNYFYESYSLSNDYTSLTLDSSNIGGNIDNIVLNMPYTCRNGYSRNCGENLYKVDSLANGTVAYVYGLTTYDNIASDSFNNDNSIAYSGYMYNSVYSGSLLSSSTQTRSANDIYLLGSSFTDNGDGTVSLTGNVAELSGTASSFLTGHSYMCFPGHYTYDANTGANTCYDAGVGGNVALGFFSDVQSTSYFTYVPVYKYGFGIASVGGGSYSLVGNNNESGTLQIGSYISLDLSKSHYTCQNLSGTCSTYYYVNYKSGDFIYLTGISNGKYVSTNLTDPNNILYDMLYKNDVNTTDSNIKAKVDSWYQNHLLQNYDSYIDDTIYCNNRTITSFGGWDPNGGKVGMEDDYELKFAENSLTGDLSCPNVTDRFSVSNPSAHLTYKVGLMSGNEMSLLNFDLVKQSKSSSWLISPDYFAAGNYNMYLTSGGELIYGASLSSALGIRPAISLKPGMRYSSGDGSSNNPFIVASNN